LQPCGEFIELLVVTCPPIGGLFVVCYGMYMRVIPIGKDHGVGATLEAVRCLKLGGVAVIPTDTAYALAADAMNPKAVEKIFAIKMRGGDKALPVMVSDFDMLDTVAVASAELKEYIRKCGSVTAVLPARGWVPLPLRGSKLSIGVRIPMYSLVERVIKGFGGPITGTSANISGRGPHYEIQDVIDDFEGGNEPDLIIDAGDLPQQHTSAVIDFTKRPPMLLRTGLLPKEVLMDLMNNR
jgi:L-threonylcarbamoyladenylate synthase